MESDKAWTKPAYGMCQREGGGGGGLLRGYEEEGVARIAFSTACSVDLGAEWQLRSGNVQGWSPGNRAAR